MRTFLLMPLVAALLSACGLGRWLASGELVDVVEVGRASLCGTPTADARVRVFDSTEAVAAWLQTTSVDLRITETIEAGRYALIEMGQRSSGGYGIAVSRDGRRVGNVLELYATFFTPGPGSVTAQMLTSPCVLVRLPAAEFGVVEVFDQRGERRATSATEK